LQQNSFTKYRVHETGKKARTVKNVIPPAILDRRRHKKKPLSMKNRKHYNNTLAQSGGYYVVKKDF